jgi:hypothetical protein
LTPIAVENAKESTVLLGVVRTLGVGRLRHDEDLVLFRILDHFRHQHGRHDEHASLLLRCVLEPMSASSAALTDDDLASYEFAPAFKRMQGWPPLEYDDQLLVCEVHMQIRPPSAWFQLVHGGT